MLLWYCESEEELDPETSSAPKDVASIKRARKGDTLKARFHGIARHNPRRVARRE
jgi:hypothetical protein